MNKMNGHFEIRDQQTPIEQSSVDVYELQEWKEYILEGDSKILVCFEQQLHQHFKIIGQKQEVGKLQFCNAVGIFQIEDPKITFKVVTNKLLIHQYEQMLEELTKIASGLPFKAFGVSSFSYDRSVSQNPEPLYHAFCYLRHYLELDIRKPQYDLILPALEQIFRNPYRRLERELHKVSPERTSRIAPETFIDLATGRSFYPDRVESEIPFIQKLKGYVPHRITEPRVISTIDTPENRFIKAFLDFASGVIMQINENLNHFSDKTTIEIDTKKMKKRLFPYIRHPAWRDVGRMTYLPFNSTILQQRRGYREIFQHFIMLQLVSKVNLNAELVDPLMQGGNIAKLYELWCFFKFVEIMQNEFDIQFDNEDWLNSSIAGISLRSGSARKVNVQLHLAYDYTFSKQNTANRFTYSLPLRPDIVLEIESESGRKIHHIFDAKYRMEIKKGLFEDINSEVAKSEELRGDYKHGDLYKMHTYHDAIPTARTVWILYPGDKFQFNYCPLTEGGDIKVPIKNIANNIEEFNKLGSPLNGVGAIPLKPDEDGNSELANVLRELL
ncbi:MAG: DUF2357 domain-containing protein [Candidatus Electryonea clarkiae]|nr:DUF2357 domain-containing protein [Candidatus Electryonea clarkiae]MDP8287274.1 DUF2357 domain-containing protein [Candidatus Electryonea clarkiae]